MAAYLPSAVILSTHQQDPTNIVKGILEQDVLPEPELGPIGVDYWNWELNNKYYTAPVHLSVVSQPVGNLSYITEFAEALLVYCDSSQPSCLTTVEDLVDSLGDFEPDVQMLVCDTCDSKNIGGLSRLEAQKWCIDRGWELIELERDDPGDTDEENDEQDDFPESLGFKRVRQALHAHTWSNLKMKEPENNLLGTIMSTVATQNSSLHTNDISYHPLSDENDQALSAMADMNGYDDEETIDPRCVQADMLGGLVDPTTLEDCLNMASGCGNFEELFSRFEQLKRTAASLPTDQRRDHAEKVAVAFWKAMGGDDEEADLDSEDDGPLF